MNTCPMCGAEALKMIKRSYRYDSGQVFINYVCQKCSDLHNQLLLNEANQILKGAN